jgi:hypothetical protein
LYVLALRSRLVLFCFADYRDAARDDVAQTYTWIGRSLTTPDEAMTKLRLNAPS